MEIQFFLIRNSFQRHFGLLSACPLGVKIATTNGRTAAIASFFASKQVKERTLRRQYDRLR